jgi:hypothetical protein
MKSVLLNGVSAVCLLLLAGCGPLAQLAAATGGGPIDLDGDGVVTAAEKVLQGYSPTYAGAAGGPTTVGAAASSAGGINGFGVGTAGVTSAADTTGTYKTANIKLVGNDLQVTVDGKSYTMSATDSYQNATIAGKSYSVRNFGVTNAELGGAGNIAARNVGSTLTLNDTASLTIFVKNYARAAAAGNFNYSYDGYSIIATGLETPASGIPTSIVSYSGGWFLISGLGATGTSSGQVSGVSGDFQLTANFGTKAVTMLAKDGSNQNIASVTGKISGNKFVGTSTGQFAGDVAGGFYGTNAQEVAGVGNGTYASQHAEVGFIGTSR